MAVPPTDFDLDSSATEDNSLVESMSVHTWHSLGKDESEQTSSAPIVNSFCCPLQTQSPATVPSIEMQQSSFAYTVDESMLLTALSVDTTLSCDETKTSAWEKMRPSYLRHVPPSDNTTLSCDLTRTSASHQIPRPSFLRHLKNALDWTLEEAGLCYSEGCNAPWTEPPSSTGSRLHRGVLLHPPMTAAVAAATSAFSTTSTAVRSEFVLQKSASASSSFSEFSQVDWTATA